MKQSLWTLLIVAGLLGSIGVAQAGDKKTPLHEAYLGVGVESVPPALYTQLPGSILPKGQGVLVGQVLKDSPAAKAGLHSHDILLSYGDQKLYSAEQLVKLVHGDKPGHEIALTFIRGGQTMASKVALGKADPQRMQDKSRVFRLLPDERLRQLFEEMEAKKNVSAWESFDALKLTRLDGKRWRAEIEYRSKEGKKEAKAFTGTRDEIRKGILAEKDLPVNERTHLLRALNLHDPVFEFHIPRWGSMPSDFFEPL